RTLKTDLIPYEPNLFDPRRYRVCHRCHVLAHPCAGLQLRNLLTPPDLISYEPNVFNPHRYRSCHRPHVLAHPGAGFQLDLTQPNIAPFYPYLMNQTSLILAVTVFVTVVMCWLIPAPVFN